MAESESNGNEVAHTLLTKIKERSTILEDTIKGVKEKILSPEIGSTLAKLSDADSRYRREILNEAIFDAKHHPDKPKPCFSQQ